MSTPTTAVRRLIRRHNLSESEIVAKLAERGIRTSQPTINRIKRGKAGAIRYEVGVGLVELDQSLGVS